MIAVVQAMVTEEASVETLAAASVVVVVAAEKQL